MCVHYITEELQ